MKRREWGTALLFFAFLELLIFLFFFNQFNKEKQDYNEIAQKNFNSLFFGAFHSYENATRMIFQNKINKPDVLYRFAQAYKNPELRDQYRREIYESMKEDYEIQKEIGLRQFHFHFKDGTSFLRVHAPEKFGDFIFDKRYSLSKANAEKIYLSGFEEGHFADGFRYVYPLFYNHEHIGTVELDVTADGIIDYINSIQQGNYNFIIKKESVMGITYPDWREAHYRLSLLSDDFVIDKSFKINNEVLRINGKLKPLVSKKLLEFKPFFETTRLDNQEYNVIFHPIKNVKGDSIAYIIKYSKEDFFIKNRRSFFLNITISTFLIGFMFFAYSKVRSQSIQLEVLNRSLEYRVKSRTAELENAMKELEDFNYTVSHDLRAPLRAIAGFSRILIEEYYNKIDQEGKRLLDIIDSNAVKMGRLIDDILSFSRLGRVKMEFLDLDMKQIAEEAWQKQSASAEGRNIACNITNLPNAIGDKEMMRQVLDNLIANAVKFTAGKEISQITIDFTAGIEENTYFVKDNGCGFDMQFTNKLFGIFSRLHGMEEYEGTGIGLAVVKRIIQKHGGKVWAEGHPNEGAIFYFSLPNKKT